MSTINSLKCPLCSSKLEKEGNSLFCNGEKRHCFDIAKSGYVNLLRPGKQSNRTAGDDNEMIKARRDFLESGLYDNIADNLAYLILDNKKIIDSFVDAGCGEGRHTLRIADILDSSDVIGLDMSKHGADKASRIPTKRDTAFIAGSIFEMPLCDKSQDVVISMFAPIPFEETFRVLKDDGILAVCSSGTNHLIEMRNVLYDEVRISEPLKPESELFSQVTAKDYSYTINLNKEQILNLFMMTPFYYRSPRQGRERLLSLDNLSVTVETRYTILKKQV